jgi:hypothetical protein
MLLNARLAGKGITKSPALCAELSVAPAPECKSRVWLAPVAGYPIPAGTGEVDASGPVPMRPHGLHNDRAPRCNGRRSSDSIRPPRRSPNQAVPAEPRRSDGTNCLERAAQSSRGSPWQNAGRRRRPPSSGRRAGGRFSPGAAQGDNDATLAGYFIVGVDFVRPQAALVRRDAIIYRAFARARAATESSAPLVAVVRKASFFR